MCIYIYIDVCSDILSDISTGMLTDIQASGIISDIFSGIEYVRRAPQSLRACAGGDEEEGEEEDEKEEQPIIEYRDSHLAGG